MAVIRLGERRPLAAPRRVELGLAGLMALQRELAAAGGPSLPGDFVVDATAVSLAGPRVEASLADAHAALRAHGVIDDDGPVDAVAANVAALTQSARRIRTSLLGEGTSLVAHHWTGPELAGSLVRDGARCTLSLFDARALGDELVGLLPESGGMTSDRTTLTAPLAALTTVAAADELPDDQTEVVGSLLGVDGATAALLRAWSERVRAVLHVTAFDTDPARLPGMLVWFVDREGWWSSRTWSKEGVRMVEVRPRRREDLAAALGGLVTQVWR